ncbi:hypothetical protein BC829DRAFT_14386 [Chytridium lagenaria]|nr:hypothetical protein BC829DRAFT_14386 [Chytridium lagenaria]
MIDLVESKSSTTKMLLTVEILMEIMLDLVGNLMSFAKTPYFFYDAFKWMQGKPFGYIPRRYIHFTCLNGLSSPEEALFVSDIFTRKNTTFAVAALEVFYQNIEIWIQSHWTFRVMADLIVVASLASLLTSEHSKLREISQSCIETIMERSHGDSLLSLAAIIQGRSARRPGAVLLSSVCQRLHAESENLYIELLITGLFHRDDRIHSSCLSDLHGLFSEHSASPRLHAGRSPVISVDTSDFLVEWEAFIKVCRELEAARADLKGINLPFNHLTILL